MQTLRLLHRYPRDYSNASTGIVKRESLQLHRDYYAPTVCVVVSLFCTQMQLSSKGAHGSSQRREKSQKGGQIKLAVYSMLCKDSQFIFTYSEPLISEYRLHLGNTSCHHMMCMFFTGKKFLKGQLKIEPIGWSSHGLCCSTTET